METVVFNAEEISLAAELLKSGEIVAFPTETVYGLGGRVFSVEAIRKIYTVKGRPSDNPLIAHIGSLGDVERLSVDIPIEFYLLAEAFFPGPLTLVLKRKPEVPAAICAGLPTIGIRMPDHPLALALIAQTGEPLAAPSANLSGKPSPTLVKHVLQDFQGKIAGVVDGGVCDIGIESTVLSLMDPQFPKMLRPGKISKSSIEEVLKRAVDQTGGKENGDHHLISPGMRYRHYAPLAKIKLFFSFSAFFSYASTISSRKMLLLSPSGCARYKEAGIFILNNQTLYALFRQADEERYEEIIIYCDQEILGNFALMNRLLKAAGSADTLLY